MTLLSAGSATRVPYRYYRVSCDRSDFPTYSFRGMAITGVITIMHDMRMELCFPSIRERGYAVMASRTIPRISYRIYAPRTHDFPVIA